MRTDIAHFTLDGTPICECQQPAYHDRMRAAGMPGCSGPVAKQAAKFERLAEQFPGRVALVHGACPNTSEA